MQGLTLTFQGSVRHFIQLGFSHCTQLFVGINVNALASADACKQEQKKQTLSLE